MKCRSCGAEIADKALICYKCGSATTDPVVTPRPASRPPSSSASLVVTVLALALLIFAALYMGRVPQGQSPYVGYVVGAAAVVLVVVRAVLRRRR